jgi:NAD(P)-dependent dehydrogenase (short-subunit alcohol dehydrogenase family)
MLSDLKPGRPGVHHEGTTMSNAGPAQNGRLQGKVAVVTGAARGIGRAATVAFGCEGADVVGIDIGAPVYPPSGAKPATREELDETGRRVESAGRRWLGLVVDQRDMLALRAGRVSQGVLSSVSPSGVTRLTRTTSDPLVGTGTGQL